MFQKPEGALTVCEYLEELWTSCLPLYSACTVAREEVLAMWGRQALADTEVFGGPGEMVECPATREALGEQEVGRVRDMVRQAYWRQDSR